MLNLRSLLSCAVAGLAAVVTVAQSPVPTGTHLNHINVLVNADGSVTKLSSAAAPQPLAPCPAVPIYDQTVPSQYYYPSSAMNIDSYPLGGPALINDITFCTYQPAGGGATLTFNIYASPVMGTDIYEIPCQPLGPVLCNATINIPSGLNSVTFTFAAPCPTQCSDIAVGVQLTPLPGSPTAGQLIAEGSSQGLVVGHPISLLRNLYQADGNGLLRGYQSSPGDSSNGFQTPAGACLWFGGRPIANFCVSMDGWFSFIGHLTGDYGGPGPFLTYPDNYIKVQITDANLSFFSEEIVRVTGPNDPAGPGYFTIPFDCANGLFDIYLYPFKGYCGACVKGIAPAPFAMACWDFSLISGDVTGDSKVSVNDLNAILANFGSIGCPPIVHGPKKPIVPLPLQALVRCVP